MPALRNTRSRATRLTLASPPSRSGAAIQRASSAGGSTHLRLTVKAPPSKLRQAISGNDLDQDPFTDSPDDTPEPPIRVARATRNVRTVIDPDSDEEDEELEQDDEDAEGQEMDEDEDEGDEDEEEEEDEDEEEEDDEEDAEDDAEMTINVHPRPPIVQTAPIPSVSKSKGKAKIAVTVSAPNEGPLKSVEAKEAELDSLSELDDLDDDEEELGDDNSDLDDSDAEGEGGATREGTPDLSKLTRRQRAAYENNEVNDGSLMALSNEAMKKKHLTAEEHAMRRAEMARRRKNLSEKRNEEEKMDTINKLLKKPAPKRRTRAEIIAAQSAANYTPGSEGEDGEYYPPANPLFVRYVQNQNGARIGVPVDWLEAPVGETVAKGWKPRVLVEEVA